MLLARASLSSSRRLLARAPGARRAPADAALSAAGRRSVYRGSSRFRRERTSPNLSKYRGERSNSDAGGPLDAYLKLLERAPLPTKAITSMCIVGAGDVATQTLLDRDKPFDVKRFAIFTFLGGALVGPTLHFWYGFLNRMIPGVGTMPALKRLAVDQTLFAASFIPIFMGSAMALEGKAAQFPEQLKREFLPALVTNWGLWIPGNFINFRFVAPRLQVLFANVVALGWNGYLSWSTHRAAHAEGGAGSTEGETWDNARVQALFEEFDTDDSGHIDPREFQDLAFALDVPMDEASVALVVERLDKDGDGQISLPEFRSWLHTSDTFMGLKGDEDAPVLQAMLLKTRLRARVVLRELRTRASGVFPQTGATPSSRPKARKVHVTAPDDSHLVRRKTIRLRNSRALRAVPTDVLEREVQARAAKEEAFKKSTSTGTAAK